MSPTRARLISAALVIAALIQMSGCIPLSSYTMTIKLRPGEAEQVESFVEDLAKRMKCQSADESWQSMGSKRFRYCKTNLADSEVVPPFPESDAVHLQFELKEDGSRLRVKVSVTTLRPISPGVQSYAAQALALIEDKFGRDRIKIRTSAWDT